MATHEGDKIVEYIDNVPGSLYLVDETPDHRGEHALHSSGKDTKDVILNPQPSRDVNDPFNWSRLRKMKTLVSLLCFVFMMGFGCSTINSSLGEITESRGISLTTLTQGIGFLYGFFGWGGIFIVPLALRFGHRPIYLLALLGTIAMVFWTPFVENSGQWLGSRMIYGFFGTPVENLAEVSISMFFFTHERGWYLGLYALILYAAAFTAPIPSGFISDADGLDGVTWFTGAVEGLIIVIVFFGFEEVSFNRHTVKARERAMTADAPAKAEEAKDGHAVTTVAPAPSSGASDELEVGDEAHRQLLGKQHSYLYTLGMFRETYCTWRQAATAVWRPIWLIFRFPCIFWSGFSLGCSLSIYTIFSGTINLVLTSEPYNFSSGTVGLAYIGPLIGSMLAGPLTGLVGDKLCLWYARKNGGVREPEHRLLLSIPMLIIVPWGFVQWGVGATHHIHWFGLVWALGLIGVYVTMQAALSVSYALDCYRDLGGEVLISLILIRNTISFAIGYSVTPLLDNLGIQNAYLTLGFSAVAFILTFIPMMMYGKRFRNESKDLYWRYVNDSAFAH